MSKSIVDRREKFIVFINNGDNKWWWVLKGKNGHELDRNGPFDHKKTCVRNIELIQDMSPRAVITFK